MKYHIKNIKVVNSKDENIFKLENNYNALIYVEKS